MINTDHGPSIRVIDHLTFVVDDLERGMTCYTETLGLTWAEPWTGKIPILLENRLHEPVVSFTLSLQGPPHLELIQATTEPPWRAEAGIHHFGIWADAFEDSIKAMTGEGYAVEAISPTSDFAYLRAPDEARIELVNGRARSDFARWLRGGSLPDS